MNRRPTLPRRPSIFFGGPRFGTPEHTAARAAYAAADDAIMAWNRDAQRRLVALAEMRDAPSAVVRMIRALDLWAPSDWRTTTDRETLWRLGAMVDEDYLIDDPEATPEEHEHNLIVRAAIIGAA